MFHQQEFIFNAPNARTRPALFARQTLLSIYHQTNLLCYLFKQRKTVTFADISNSAEQLLTHQAQQRKFLPKRMLMMTKIYKGSKFNAHPPLTMQ